jgi:hypothetical protein
VGITSKDMMKRWHRHVIESGKNNSKNACYFHRAIQKYGKDDWHHIVLETIECANIKEAEECEIKWIKIYESNNRLYGYNSTSGGKINEFTLEVREKISKKIKENLTPELLELQSKKMKKYYESNPNPFKGKQHTEESKLKMSEKIKKYYKNNPNPFKDKNHTDEAKALMSKKFKERLSKDNFVSNFKLMTPEQRQKAINASKEARKNLHFSKFDFEKVQELAKQCYTNTELAKLLGCTNAHISYLKKRIKLEFKQKEINSNKIIEIILKEASSVKTIKELCKKLHISEYILHNVLKKNNKSIEEVKTIISGYK